MRKLLFLIFLNCSIQISGQLKKNIDYWKIVLEKSIIGKKFTFGKWDENGNDELVLTYLGTIIYNRKKFKIMTSIWYWGLSGRATSRILIYDNRNKFLGDYYLDLTCEIPKKIQNNSIIFQPNCEDNSQKTITSISFNNKGIPKYLVVKHNRTTQLISTFNKAD